MPYKLLLADDSVTIQKVIELTFADEDITVIAVGDGRQAIERVRAEKPDIVLADVGMPERDGYEVAAFIKGTPELAHIPVLLLTGAFEPIDEGRARAARCDGVLVKPFEPQMVITRVKDLIAGKRPTAAAPSAAPPPFSRPSPPPATPASVEDYFDRLDSVFASKDGEAGRPPVPWPGTEGARTARPTELSPADTSGLMSELATWESELSLTGTRAAAPETPVPPTPEAPPPAASTPPSAAPQAGTPPAIPSLAEAFAALLSAEQAHPFAPPAADGAGLDDLVEQVTRRVIERLTDGAVREVVVDVAERLVREEIARIKTPAS